MRLALPKSIQESQRYLSWVFPILLGFGISSLPATNWYGTIALSIGLVVVVTGWLSFGIIPEKAYNDVLFIVDLSLLATYWLVLYYSRSISAHNGSADSTVFNLSGVIFLLYAIWDVTALAGRDTAALATAQHLQRFIVICLGFSIAFFALGGLTQITRERAWLMENPSTGLRLLGLGIWCTILVSWHVGRMRAATKDAHEDEGLGAQ